MKSNPAASRDIPQTKGRVLILRAAVAVPAISILACITVLVSRVLPPRSPYIATISLVIDTMSFIEVVSLAILLRSLIKSDIARSIGNILLGVLGALSLLPALAVAILIAEGSFRQAGG